MTEERVKRKLSAILSADVVEYSRLMGDDEVSTVKTLEAYRKVMADLIGQFRGRVVDSPGDNLLAEFPSVVDAVQCAVEIHEVIRAKNEELPEDRRMLFRIGVNLGDVIQEGERIYGDGVNIAARLEGLAEPGGVCISGSAHEQIKNKLALGYKYIGEHTVKNIAEPLKVYKVPVGPKALMLKKEEEKKTRLKKQSTTLGVTKAKKGIGLRQILPWVASTIVVAAIIVVAVILNLRESESKRVVYLDYVLPEGHQLNYHNAGFSLAVSPDGNQFIYGTKNGFYLRTLNVPEARTIAGTDAFSFLPVFSPDGKWIGYWSGMDRKLKKVAISGGVPKVLCETGENVWEISWTEDNTLIYTDGDDLKRVSGDGGTPEVVIAANSIGGYPVSPQMLPDGKTLLFTKDFGGPSMGFPSIGNMIPDNSQITILSLESGNQVELIQGQEGKYISTGHIVFIQINNNVRSLMAVPFNLEDLELASEPVPLIEDVGGSAFSDSGTLVYVSQPPFSLEAGEFVTKSGKTITLMSNVIGITPEELDKVMWVDFEGKEKQIDIPANYFDIPASYYNYLQISPDGTKLAIADSDDISIWDLKRQIPTKLTFDGNKGRDSFPIWSPDGKKIAFYSSREPGPKTLQSKGDSKTGVFCKSIDGKGEEELLYEGEISPNYWASDENILCSQFQLVESRDIFMLNINEDKILKPLLNESFNEDQPRLSPTGRWLAYCSDESGKKEVYVRPYPKINMGQWQISTDGGNSPLWSPDGHELFYRKDNSVIRVTVETEPTFKPLTHTLLFKGSYDSNSWDIHPDGDRFLMIKGPELGMRIFPTESVFGNPRKINIVLNWDEELKKIMPAD